jgi:L-alanine-DL-glutamate epimerase-like enolase superfamily enzyme
VSTPPITSGETTAALRGALTIVGVTAIPILVPRKWAMVATQGAVISSEFGLVRIETDGGIVGWGEISMTWGRIGRSLVQDVENYLGPALVGLDPLDIQGCMLTVERAMEGGEAAKAGLDNALFDIAGKALGVPAYQLLGGRARPAVPVAWAIPWGEPEETAATASWAADEGFRTVKLKVGRPGTIDRRAVAAVRQAVGDEIEIKVDANMAYRSAGSALRALRPLEEFRLQLIEQPLPARDLDELALLRSRLETPLLVDESSATLRDVGEVLRRGAADVFNIYVSEAGGMLAACKAFAAVEAAGFVGLIGSQCELGLGTAGCAHLGVAVANLAYESDIVGPLRYPRDIVVDPPLIVDGLLYPPDKPGLGVTVDEEAVDAFRIDR